MILNCIMIPQFVYFTTFNPSNRGARLFLCPLLRTYRKKDSIEKILHSLKNEIEIKPLCIWTDNSIYSGKSLDLLRRGFLKTPCPTHIRYKWFICRVHLMEVNRNPPQLFISLVCFKIPELKHTSTKFIK